MTSPAPHDAGPLSEAAGVSLAPEEPVAGPSRAVDAEDANADAATRAQPVSPAAAANTDEAAGSETPRLSKKRPGKPLAADSAKRARMPFKAPIIGGTTTTPSRPSKSTPSKPFASITRGFKPLIPTATGTLTPGNKRAKPSGPRTSTPFRAPTLAGAAPVPTTTDSPVGASKMALTSEISRLERRLRVLQQALRYRDMADEVAESPAKLEAQGERWLQHGRAAAELLWTVSGGADGAPTEQALPRQSLFEDDDRGRWGRGDVSYTTLSSAEKDALSDAEAADPLPSAEELQDEVRRRIERHVRKHRSNPPSSEVDVPKPAWNIGAMLRRIGLDPVVLLGYDDEAEDWAGDRS